MDANKDIPKSLCCVYAFFTIFSCDLVAHRLAWRQALTSCSNWSNLFVLVSWRVVSLPAVHRSICVHKTNIYGNFISSWRGHFPAKHCSVSEAKISYLKLVKHCAVSMAKRNGLAARCTLFHLCFVRQVWLFTETDGFMSITALGWCTPHWLLHKHRHLFWTERLKFAAGFWGHQEEMCRPIVRSCGQT